MSVITGTAAGETLLGTTDSDVLSGLGGDDVLNGDLGGDTLDGGDGNDTLIGGGGADRLLGGTGADTATYASSSAAVTLTLDGPAGSGGDAAGDTLNAVEWVIGSSHDDRLAGNHVSNRLYGGAGSDLIFGAGGNDRVDGGDGNDTLEAGDGDDQLVGGAGADRLLGGTGVDSTSYAASGSGVTVTLDGPAGAGGDAEGDAVFAVEWVTGSSFGDRLTGNHVSNRLYGGPGNDTLMGLDGNDLLDGGVGHDRLDGGAGSFDQVSYASSAEAATVNLATGAAQSASGDQDVLAGIENVTGSGLDDLLIGDGALNQLDGGGGNDTLIGGAGADRLLGGTGVDTASYATSAAGVSVTLDGPAGSGADGQGDVLYYVEWVLGSNHGDQLVGNVQSNRLYGGAGSDRLDGAGGNDLLDGGSGNDTLAGGVGADVLYGGFGSDQVTYSDAPSGVTAYLDGRRGVGGTAVGDSLSGVEHLTGSGYSDLLVGDGEANTISGGDGDDTLQSFGGRDTLDGGAGVDTVSYAFATVGVTVQFGLGEGPAGELFRDVERVEGSAYDDVLIGNGFDYLAGAGGNDMLMGGFARDTFVGGDGFDTVSYSDAQGSITVFLDGTAAVGDEAQGDLLFGIEGVIGSGFADHLYGNGAANLLDGGAGNDTFYGSAGSDTFIGGTGYDTVRYGAPDGIGAVVYFDGRPGLAGDGAGDRLYEIESVIGSFLDDAIYGDASSNTIFGGDGNDTIISNGGGDQLNGGNGADWIGLGDTAGEIYLNNGQLLYPGGSPAGASLFQFENALGSSGNDTLFGNGGNNILIGGAGNDFLNDQAGTNTLIGGAGADGVYGGLGMDWTDYTASPSAVTIYLDNLDNTSSGGDAEGDRVAGVEGVIATGWDDRVFGGYLNDRLYGGGGSDLLSGGIGVNHLYGGDGDDLLKAGFNSSDVIDGGAGVDTADYSDSQHWVNANLAAGSADDFGHLDQLVGIENLRGSNFDDTLAGDSGANWIHGGDGNDTISGGGGTDTLIGGVGEDRVFVTDLACSIVGGADFDVVNASALATVQFGAIAGTMMEVEALDLTGGGGTALTIGVPQSGAPLYVMGDASDSVSFNAGTWTAAGSAVFRGVSYSIFAESMGAQIYIESEMVIVPSP